MKIYSMKGLAKQEGVTPEYLRVLTSKIAKGELLEWRDYRFFGLAGKCWFAYAKDQAVEFFD